MANVSKGRIALGVILLPLFALSVGAAGCATRQTGKAQPSGFLGNYSKLHKGSRGEPQLVYIRSNVRWTKYNAVMIDPVTIWLSSEDTNLSKQDAKRLTDSFHQALEEALGKDYRIVDEPGPGVLRVRAAITEVQGAKVLLNAATGLVPQLRLPTMIVGMGTDTAVVVGKCSVEGEVVDSMTGKRLIAGVSQRAGTKDPRNMLNKWADVDSAFKEWSERLRKRLESLRAA